MGWQDRLTELEGTVRAATAPQVHMILDKLKVTEILLMLDNPSNLLKLMVDCMFAAEPKQPIQLSKRSRAP